MAENVPSSRVAEIKLDMIEFKIDRLIDEMRLLKSRTIAFDTRMRAIEAYLKPSEQANNSSMANSRRGSRPLASAMARTGAVCNRGSGRGDLDRALSGNMTRQR